MFYKLKFLWETETFNSRILLRISYIGTWKMQSVLPPEYQPRLTWILSC
jgi:hypothetical protein